MAAALTAHRCLLCHSGSPFACPPALPARPQFCLFFAQSGLVLWRKRHQRSYELVTLLGLWLVPPIICFHVGYWRFLAVRGAGHAGRAASAGCALCALRPCVWAASFWGG